MSLAFEGDARQRVNAALTRMQALHPQLIDLGLPRILNFLDRLGRPQDRVPPAIHVAGTNGKGSTLAFMRAILEASGASIHTFISPHLVRFNERIRLAGHLIEDAALADLLDRCEAANQGRDITYFEITTAAAFLGFAETPADFLLLETGLGGRLDATNVIDEPMACVITSISHDHERFLGETIGRIAWEKAGIIKPGVPVVIAPQEYPEATEVLLRRAGELNAPVLCHGRDWSVEGIGNGFMLRQGLKAERYSAPALPGRHQFDNAASAIVALQVAAPERANSAAITGGLESATWPARLQALPGLEPGASLPAGWTLWLDGGHNAGAARALTAWSEGRDKPLYLIIGLLQRKDAGGFMAPFAGRAGALAAIPVPSQTPSVDPLELAENARKAGIAETCAATDAGAALARLTGGAYPPGDIVICGSLYLAGAVLKTLNQLPGDGPDSNGI